MRFLHSIVVNHRSRIIREKSGIERSHRNASNHTLTEILDILQLEAFWYPARGELDFLATLVILDYEQ